MLWQTDVVLRCPRIPSTASSEWSSHLYVCGLHWAPKYQADEQREFQGYENTKLSERLHHHKNKACYKVCNVIR